MKKLLLILLISSQQLLAQGFFSRGGGMGNGGHPYEIEFKQDAKKILESLVLNKAQLPAQLAKINLYNLEMNIELTDLELKKKKLKDKFGRVKAALNFPSERLIQFNKSNWEKIQSKDHLRLPFVLHEYLGLSGEEVDHYKISSTYYEFLVQVNALKNIGRQKIIKDRASLIELETVSSDNYSPNKNYKTYKYVTSRDLEFVYGGMLSNKRLDSLYIYSIDHDAAKSICRDLGYDSFMNIYRSRWRAKIRDVLYLKKDTFGFGLVLESKTLDEKVYGYTFVSMMCVK